MGKASVPRRPLLIPTVIEVILHIRTLAAVSGGSILDISSKPIKRSCGQLLRNEAAFPHIQTLYHLDHSLDPPMTIFVWSKFLSFRD